MLTPTRSISADFAAEFGKASAEKPCLKVAKTVQRSEMPATGRTGKKSVRSGWGGDEGIDAEDKGRGEDAEAQEEDQGVWQGKNPAPVIDTAAEPDDHEPQQSARGCGDR
ncbi:MAG TPA: hypothetical protein VLT87_20545 [Thermoanaerobaculia bacterium]|nr:hypothetical protein [Thermoanaerobaculia bacterium]